MYDICFIGGGLNYAGAVVAAKEGMRVALIERDLESLGGTCLHRGCIPSKMFLHYAYLGYATRTTPIFSQRAVLDMAQLQQEKSELIKSAHQAILRQCKDVTLIEGDGKITAPHEIRVGERTIEATHVVIGTGSRPFIPEGIAYDGEHIITSDEVLKMSSLPKSIAIYGNGAIGLEMASFFAGCGVKTALIYRFDDLFPNAHPMISASMQKQLEALGVILMPNCEITEAKSIDRSASVLLKDGTHLMPEILLVATGREPNTDVVACSQIALSQHGIETDEMFETTESDHFAIGDCNGKIQLAHAARAQVLNVVNRLLNRQPPILNLDYVVKFIHTLPMSYATVGLTREALQKLDEPFKESVVPLNAFTYSHIHHAKDGVIVVYTDSENFIIGAEILAPNAEELISTAAMALTGELSAALAKETILAHPTFSEALERAFFKL